MDSFRFYAITISQLEGYIYKDATGNRYVYQYKDHLGNNRLLFT